MLDFLIVLLNMIRMFLDEYELIMFNINKYLMLRGGGNKKQYLGKELENLNSHFK